MPVLRNARREKAAQNLVRGMSQTAAYAKAGYVENADNAARLFAKPEVAARVRELQGRAAARAVKTVDDIVRQLADDRDLAYKTESASAAVSASLGQAKVLGLIVDRHMVGMKRLEDMNEAELEAFLGQGGDRGSDRNGKG